MRKIEDFLELVNKELVNAINRKTYYVNNILGESDYNNGYKDGLIESIDITIENLEDLLVELKRLK